MDKDIIKQKSLNYLGLAARAGLLVTGEDNVIVEMRKNKVKIVFVANDSSSKTIDNFQRKCYFYKVPCSLEYTSAEISSAIGKDRHIIGLTDEGIYKAMEKIKGE